MDNQETLHEAIKRIGLTALAKAVGVKPPSVCKWREKGSVPANRVPAVSQITGLPYSRLNASFPDTPA